jgi:hypothetical protein
MAPRRDDHRGTARDLVTNHRERFLNNNRRRKPGQVSLGDKGNDTIVLRNMTIRVQRLMRVIIRREKGYQEQKEHRHDGDQAPDQPCLQNTVGRRLHAVRNESKPASHGKRFLAISSAATADSRKVALLNAVALGPVPIDRLDPAVPDLIVRRGVQLAAPRIR